MPSGQDAADAFYRVVDAAHEKRSVAIRQSSKFVSQQPPALARIQLCPFIVRRRRIRCRREPYRRRPRRAGTRGAHLEAASGEFCYVAQQMGAAGASLSGPVALLVQDVTEPAGRALLAEAHEIALLACELRLVSQAIQRALAGGIEPRLAVDRRRRLDEMKRRRGGLPPFLHDDAVIWDRGETGLRARTDVRALGRYLQSLAGRR